MVEVEEEQLLLVGIGKSMLSATQALTFSSSIAPLRCSINQPVCPVSAETLLNILEKPSSKHLFIPGSQPISTVPETQDSSRDDEMIIRREGLTAASRPFI